MLSLIESLRWCAVDDIVYVLDTRAGEYFALDPGNSAAWVQLFQHSGSSALPNDGPLVAVLHRRGWLVDEAHTSVPRTAHRRWVGWTRFARAMPRLAAVYYLWCTQLALRTRGFERTYEWADRGPEAKLHPSVDKIERSLGYFRAAESLVFNPRGVMDCLPRSLALFAFLSMQGHSVRHVIGVRRYPFKAHAWVEQSGRKLLEMPTFGATPSSAPGRGVAEFVPIAILD